MNFLIMGCGSIGERHVSNIKKKYPKIIIDIFDESKKRLDLVSSKYKANAVSKENIGKKYDCVFICTPPIFHVELAKKALKAASNVVIEKPLSTTINGITNLQKLADKERKLVFVAYNFRFNKGIQKIKQITSQRKLGKPLHVSAYFGQYLPDWRPQQDYSKGYTAQKKLGGGIIHDGSHEINYLMWFFQKPVSLMSTYSMIASLKTDTEAIADILLKFENNILGYIHLDFIRREYKRSLEILYENGIVQWSLSEDYIRIFDAKKKTWKKVKLNEKINDMYLEELNHIIECIKKNKKSNIIGLEEGMTTMKLSMAIHKSGKTGKEVFF